LSCWGSGKQTLFLSKKNTQVLFHWSAPPSQWPSPMSPMASPYQEQYAYLPLSCLRPRYTVQNHQDPRVCTVQLVGRRVHIGKESCNLEQIVHERLTGFLQWSKSLNMIAVYATGSDLSILIICIPEMCHFPEHQDCPFPLVFFRPHGFVVEVREHHRSTIALASRLKSNQ